VLDPLTLAAGLGAALALGGGGLVVRRRRRTRINQVAAEEQRQREEAVRAAEWAEQERLEREQEAGRERAAAERAAAHEGAMQEALDKALAEHEQHEIDHPVAYRPDGRELAISQRVERALHQGGRQLHPELHERVRRAIRGR